MTIKKSQWTAVVGLIIISWSAFSANSIFSQSSSASQGETANTSALQVVASGTVNGTQQLVVVDQSQKSLAVYHVDATGNVQLRSVRNLVWDLKMEEFNGQSPTPSELRRLQP